MPKKHLDAAVKSYDRQTANIFASVLDNSANYYNIIDII